MRRWIAAAAVSLAVLSSGCGFGAGFGAAPGPVVHLTIGTAVPGVVSVNGSWVGTYPPGASVDVPIGGHGGPPYTITVHSPKGGELATFEIIGPDVSAVAGGAGVGGSSGTACGSIEFSFGATGAAGAGPVADPGAPAAVPDPAACP